MKTLKLKKRIEKFYTSVEDQELAFALYVDTDDYVHYHYCTYDTDKHTMLEQQFYKDFTQD